MANPTHFTIEQYTVLVAAIASGTKEVRYSDKTVVYQDTMKMLAVKAQMESELGLNDDGSPTNKGRRRIGVYCND